MPVQLKRYEGNPILAPHPANVWENLAVFNPAAWYDRLDRPSDSASTG